jgi:hypothetical protein
MATSATTIATAEPRKRFISDLQEKNIRTHQRSEPAVTNRFRSGTATGPQQRRCQTGWLQPSGTESSLQEHPDNQRHSPVSAAGWRKIAAWEVWVEG